MRQSGLQPRPCCSSPRAGGGCRTSWEDALCPALRDPLTPAHAPLGGLVLAPSPPALGGQMAEAEAVFYNPHLWLFVEANTWLNTSMFTWPFAEVFWCSAQNAGMQNAYQMMLVGHLQWASETWGLKEPLHGWSWPHYWPQCFLPLASLVGWCWRCPRTRRKAGGAVPPSLPGALPSRQAPGCWGSPEPRAPGAAGCVHQHPAPSSQLINLQSIYK